MSNFPTEQAPQQQRPQNPLANYHFSSDELRVLKECNTESFFQRSLPIGTAFGVAAYFSVKSGYFRPNARFGAGPKVALSVIFGYFIGKFSYQQKCAEKIMQLPNSRLAEVLKAKKRGTFYETFTPDQGFGASLGMAPFANQPSSTEQYSDEFYSQLNKSNPLDLDTDRPLMSELDGENRGDVDAETKYQDNLPITPPQNPVTFEELRKQNREEYQKKNTGIYGQSLSVYDEPTPPISRAPPLRRDDPPPQTPTGPKNKYGDTWSK